jgi:hypothetical protein
MAEPGDYESEIKVSTGDVFYVRETSAQVHSAMNKALTSHEAKMVGLTRDDGAPLSVALDHIVYCVPRSRGDRPYKPGTYRKRGIND